MEFRLPLRGDPPDSSDRRSYFQPAFMEKTGQQKFFRKRRGNNRQRKRGRDTGIRPFSGADHKDSRSKGSYALFLLLLRH